MRLTGREDAGGSCVINTLDCEKATISSACKEVRIEGLDGNAAVSIDQNWEVREGNNPGRFADHPYRLCPQS